MSAFLSSFASYLIKMVILVAVALLGGIIGVSIRKSKNSKAEITEAKASEESDQ